MNQLTARRTGRARARRRALPSAASSDRGQTAQPTLEVDETATVEPGDPVPGGTAAVAGRRVRRWSKTCGTGASAARQHRRSPSSRGAQLCWFAASPCRTSREGAVVARTRNSEYAELRRSAMLLDETDPDDGSTDARTERRGAEEKGSEP